MYLENIKDKNNFKAAQKVVEDYKKLRLNKKSKNSFNLKEKLSQLGYDYNTFNRDDTSSFFEDTEFNFIRILPTTCVANIQQTIVNGENNFLGSFHTEDWVFHGDKEFNQSYCEQHNLQILELDYDGGTMISTKDDLGLAVVFNSKHDLLHTLQTILLNILQAHNTDNHDITIEKNDILINGYKIIGGAIKKIGAYTVYFFQCSFTLKPELIDNICLKEQLKEPKGMNEFLALDREVLFKELEAYINNFGGKGK